LKNLQEFQYHRLTNSPAVDQLERFMIGNHRARKNSFAMCHIYNLLAPNPRKLPRLWRDKAKEKNTVEIKAANVKSRENIGRRKWWPMISWWASSTRKISLYSYIGTLRSDDCKVRVQEVMHCYLGFLGRVFQNYTR
jgi:hypothetical protein